KAARHIDSNVRVRTSAPCRGPGEQHVCSRSHTLLIALILTVIAFHWMISSERPNSDCGIVRPKALALFKLMISSNFVGCSTGRSAGLAPLRILSTYVAERRNMSGRLAAYAIKTNSAHGYIAGSLFFAARSTIR